MFVAIISIYFKDPFNDNLSKLLEYTIATQMIYNWPKRIYFMWYCKHKKGRVLFRVVDPLNISEDLRSISFKKALILNKPLRNLIIANLHGYRHKDPRSAFSVFSRIWILLKSSKSTGPQHWSYPGFYLVVIFKLFSNNS